MTKAATYNQWCIEPGADFRVNLRRTDKSLPKIANPNYDSDCPPSVDNPLQITAPKDLTGYTAKMDIRADEDVASTLLISLETGSGITIGSPDPADGTIEIFIDNTVTIGTEFLDRVNNDVYYALALKPSGGDIQPILRGRIRIADPVTDYSGF
jgi:hypothetical protein